MLELLGVDEAFSGGFWDFSFLFVLPNSEHRLIVSIHSPHHLFNESIPNLDRLGFDENFFKFILSVFIFVMHLVLVFLLVNLIFDRHEGFAAIQVIVAVASFQCYHELKPLISIFELIIKQFLIFNDILNNKILEIII